MNKLVLICLFLSCSTLAIEENKYHLATSTVAGQKDRTRFVEAQVIADVSTTDGFVDYIKARIGYDLICQHETYVFQHAKTSQNYENPQVFGAYSIIYGISNKTDNDMFKNGYEMFDAYRWLLQNPNKHVSCQLKYQSKAGFSDNPITVTVASSGLPISASFSTTKGDTLDALSTQIIRMYPPETPSDGGGGDSCIAHCTPLIIDLAGNGITLGPRGSGVPFDMLGIGNSLTMQWVKQNGDEAFLVHDINRNGMVDDGRELFGSGTFMIEDGVDSYQAPNGFVALAQYDTIALGGDDDGFITVDDNIWRYLSLWLDSNADGVSEPSEMLSLEQVGIDKLSIIPKSSNQSDDAGNLLPLWSWVYGKQKLKMVDVYFRLL